MTHTTHDDEIVEEVAGVCDEVEFLHGVPVKLPSQTKALLRGNVREALAQARADQDRISREEERVAVLNEAIQVSEECERGQHTEFDEWRAFKCFRNTLRSRLTTQNNNTV